MLTNKGTKELRTDRLILRRFTIDDASDMFSNWASDERVTRFLTWQPHKSEEETKQLLEVWCADYERPDYYNWVIIYDGMAIGNISVARMSERSEYSELGYCMGHDFWGKGIMTEAVSAVVDFLFGEVGMNRVCICHSVKNPASGRVAQKCGFSYEGTQRERFKAADGEFMDISFYGILRREWEENKKDRLYC